MIKPLQQEALRTFLGPVVVYGLGPDRSILDTPRGRRLIVSQPAAQLRSWVARCRNGLAPQDVLKDMPDGFAAVVDALRTDGCLADREVQVEAVWRRVSHPSLDVSALRRTTIIVIDAGKPAQMLGRALQGGEYRSVRMEPLAGATAAPPDPDCVVVAVFDWPAQAELLMLDELLGRTSTRWVALRYQGGRAYLGPAITPGTTANLRDVVLRRKAAARDVQVNDVVWAAGREDQPPATHAEWAWIAATAAVQIERWVAGAYRADVTDSELELDPIEGTVAHHAVLPLPDRILAKRPDRTTAPPADPQRLVDAQTGIIRRIRAVTETDSHMPPALYVAVAELADMRRILAWPNDRRTFGTSWDSFRAAAEAATGEAVERYCGNWLPPDREVAAASYFQLRDQGDDAVDPDSLVLYSERQYGTKGFPFVPFRRDSRAGWVRGWSLTHHRPTWVPAFLVYVSWPPQTSEAEPRFSYPNLTGIAAGPTGEYATRSGLEEVIERDAGMVWWAHARALPPMPMPEVLKQLIAPVASRFEARLVPISNEFAVPAVAAVVRDRDTGWLTIGTAVRHTATDAARKALAEAFTHQQTCRSLDDPVAFSRIPVDAAQNFGHLKPWRTDRNYLDAYRADFHDMIDMICQLQAHLDSRAARRAAEWIWCTPQPEAQTPASLHERSVRALRERVEGQGFEVISVDVTTSDVALAGLHVHRTVVPGLVANFPAAFPQWGRARIQRMGVALGWRTTELPEEDLNSFPMPYA